MKTILVTGVGAIIGYGIIRSLQKIVVNNYLIGADIYPDAVGQTWCDHFVVAPLTSSADYLEWLKKTLTENKVDLVIPGIEQDVHYFSDHREIFRQLSITVVLNNKYLVDISRDKWLMHQELENINSEARISSYLDGDFNSFAMMLGLPFILKPRRGYASKGLVRISSEADYSKFSEKLGSELMAQPIVGTDDEEYTVAVFGDGLGNVCASITLLRKLATDGSTVKAWVRQHKGLDDIVASLCAHFKPIGPTNLQFRKKNSNWKLLEINPRISSSTSIRTGFGYNESKMCLDFYLDGKIIIQPEIKKGFANRYIEDIINYDSNNF